MNQPLGSVTLDAARTVLAKARLAREDFMAYGFTIGRCRRRQWLHALAPTSFYVFSSTLRYIISRTNSTAYVLVPRKLHDLTAVAKNISSS
jgi:hypothetical protein